MAKKHFIPLNFFRVLSEPYFNIRDADFNRPVLKIRILGFEKRHILCTFISNNRNASGCNRQPEYIFVVRVGRSVQRSQ